MYSDGLRTQQLSAWLASALIPVLLQLSGGIGWPSALLVVSVCSAATAAVWKWGRMPTNPVLGAIQSVYIVVLISQLLPRAAAGWPGDNYPAVPLILLALAAWSAQRGASAAARVGCVLFWFVLLIYLAVICAGINKVKIDWLRPTAVNISWSTLTMLLIPSTALNLRRESNEGLSRFLLPGVFLLAGTAITAGVLSAQQAQRFFDPFYTVSQCLDLFGVAQRFEAVLSAGMTAGWFCLLTYLLAQCAVCAEKIKRGWGRIAVYVCATGAAGLMLCNMHISWWIQTILASVFWVVIPILTQGLVERKKS